MAKIDISIVILTYNEEKTIIDKLDNTISLNYPKDKMEIVIVDCSNDNTVNLINDWIKNHKEVKLVLHHDNERLGKGVVFATNKGKEISSGNIIVRTDSDAILDKECLNLVLETFKDEKIGCVTGKPTPIGSISEENYRDINTKIQIIESKIDSTIISHGPFTSFRKNIPFVLEEGFAAEDSGISVRIRKMGYRSILNPKIIFYEKISTTGREEQKVRRATGLISLMWKNKDVLFNLKYGWYGMIIYPFNFTLFIVLPLLLSPLLIPLILLKIKGGTVLETFSFLLKAIHRLLFTKKYTMYWEKEA